MFNVIEQKLLTGGQEIIIETGKLARQSDGAVMVKVGGTMLLATVVSAKEAKPGVDFMPLTVEYREKFASTGKFPGGFFKREARPTDEEILVARLIDRALRPLFPDDYHADTQVVVNLVSSDKKVQPDALACLAASAALAVSDIPFNGPISEVRVARLNGQFVVNPTIEEMENNCDLDMIVAATMDNIMMVEGEMKEVAEAVMMEAISVAHDAIKGQCQAQLDLAAKVEKAQTKREYNHEENDFDFKERLRAATYQGCYDVAKQGTPNKQLRKEAFAAVKDDFVATLTEEEVELYGQYISKYFHDIEKDAVRRVILDERIRLDGRKLDEIRPIECEVNYLPGAHGSALFTRGETQSLTTVTLGSKLDEQTQDGAFNTGSAKFMLHYNFPPFSTGEAKPIRSTSRREIGHGNLALRALKPVIPTGTDNPYTIRVVSDILESNGSSSMATVCAGSLALMDAGVKTSAPVSGIAMGLITDNAGKYAVLSDILGDEDHLGDMDFKVTGTEKGITACQMDIKVDGLSHQVMSEALDQAKRGRLHILGIMNATINKPSEDYKPHAPRIVQMIIPKEMIGAVIGPGGKVIQEIQKESSTVIVIEEVDNKGVVSVVSENKDNLDRALMRIKAIVAIPEVGEIYEGKVKNIAAFGAFVEILPGKDGLLHISEIDWTRVAKVEDVLKEGDKIQVKLIEVDEKTGKLKLSRKALLPKPEKTEAKPQA